MHKLSTLNLSLPPFVLASGSPQRQSILKQMGLNFKVDPANVDEDLKKIKLKKPHAIVKHLAFFKAQAISKKYKNKAILGGDTLVVNNKGKILEKPKNKIEARQMLKSYNGCYCDVYSGLAWLDPKQKEPFVAYEKTRIYFKNISQKEMESYLQDGEWRYCSGGVKIEKIELWVKKMKGDYWNVVGLPVNLLKKIPLSFPF